MITDLQGLQPKRVWEPHKSCICTVLCIFREQICVLCVVLTQTEEAGAELSKFVGVFTDKEMAAEAN